MDPLKELPLGFGMALVQNEAAMQRFEALSEPARQQILASTHYVSSKAEMQALVSKIGRDFSDEDPGGGLRGTDPRL